MKSSIVYGLVGSLMLATLVLPGLGSATHAPGNTQLHCERFIRDDCPNIWYLKDMDVVAHCHEPLFPRDAACVQVCFRLDAGPWVCNRGFEAPFVVRGEGIHVVWYFSTLSNGIVEPVKGPTFIKIDKTDPGGFIGRPAAGHTYVLDVDRGSAASIAGTTVAGDLTARVVANDGCDGSGLKKVELHIDESRWVKRWTYPERTWCGKSEDFAWRSAECQLIDLDLKHRWELVMEDWAGRRGHGGLLHITREDCTG